MALLLCIALAFLCGSYAAHDVDQIPATDPPTILEEAQSIAEDAVAWRTESRSYYSGGFENNAYGFEPGMMNLRVYPNPTSVEPNSLTLRPHPVLR